MKKSGKAVSIGLFVLTLFSWSVFVLPTPVSAGCGGPIPPKPNGVWAKQGPGAGEVTLTWNEVPYADRYAIEYGTSSWHYTYGATNIGGASSRSYTVKSLSPATKYYFRLSAAHGCASSPASGEVWAWSGGGMVVTQAVVVQTPTGGAQAWTPPSTMASNLSAWSGPGVGQVTLKWWHKEDADTYHLVYGSSGGQYQYGALNIGKVTQFTVGHLAAGRGYYFAIVPVKGNRALYTSDAVWAVAKAPVVEVVQTVPANVMEPVVSETEPQTMIDPVEEGAVYAAEPEMLNEDGEAVEEGSEVEDIDEPGDYDENDSNVQGMMDEYNYDASDDGYAAQNQAVDEGYGVGGPEDSYVPLPE